MLQKMKLFLIVTVVFSFLLSSVTLLASLEYDSSSPNADYINSSISEVTMSNSIWVDLNKDKIADDLEQLINNMIVQGKQLEYIDIIVTLDEPPSIHDLEYFFSLGGYLTTGVWTEAIYGFGGALSAESIFTYVNNSPNLLLVEKDEEAKVNIAYAAQQIGVRDYVWRNLDLRGDPFSSTAIIDTGIDASHQDFASGYGDKDFSNKIVGWIDETGFSSYPFDENGHGSHIAGLVAGDGFSSIDTSGNSVASSGAKIELSGGGNYLMTGFMVNNSGLISLDTRWTGTGTARLSSIELYNGDNFVNTEYWNRVKSINTPNENTVYELNYQVSSVPSENLDIYHVILSTQGFGNLCVAFNVSWPFISPEDDFPAWTGVAPDSKLVGVKVLDSDGSGSTTDVINGINWVIQNRFDYHITVASLSLGFESESFSLNTAVMNLVNSGITTVVAAGNSGSGSNFIHSPGSVDEAITVAAMNQFDSISSYSSQGGTSRHTGNTVKPDIVSPGGSRYASSLLSADSNLNDCQGAFEDIQFDDLAMMQGTSMATPIISGSVQVIVQALGGFNEWNYSRNQALLPKMLLLMTATETYPNKREMESSFSPTLNRGGKDPHEGYGRVNLDAAVEAVLLSIEVGENITDNLGLPPFPEDVSVAGQPLSWARNVELKSGNRYTFSLEVPIGADFDLYLYDSKGSSYGEPVILAKSTNATTGGIEQFWFDAPYSGTYYIVVKRATENTGAGDFVLSSSGSYGVTILTPGLQDANNVVNYTRNGSLVSGDIVDFSFFDYVDNATELTIANPIYISDMYRYVTDDLTSFVVSSNSTFTVAYRTQYYISINSSYGDPTASQWVNEGGDFNVSVDSPYETINGTRWLATGFVIDGAFEQSGTFYSFNNLAGPHYIEFIWIPQFYLNVNSKYGAVMGSGWYDSGEIASASLLSSLVTEGNNTRHPFLRWEGDGSGTDLVSDTIIMDSPKKVVAIWATQYYLSAFSPFGTIDGEGWYDANESATVTLSTSIVNESINIQHVFLEWTGDASGFELTSNPIIINEPKMAFSNWTTQYLISFDIFPPDSGETTPSGNNQWIKEGNISINAVSYLGYTFEGWSSSTNAITLKNPNSSFTTAEIEGPGTISASFYLSPIETTAPTSTPLPAQPSPTIKPSTTPFPTENSNSPSPSPSPIIIHEESPPLISSSPTPEIPEFPAILLFIFVCIITITVVIINRRISKLKK